MADASDPLLTPGNRITVIQQTPRQGGVWTSRTTGTVVHSGQARTTWPFAHARHDRLWLDRLWLRLDDGEIVVLNLDQYARIESAPAPGSDTPGSDTPGGGIPVGAAPGSAGPGSGGPAGPEADAGASSEAATPASGGSAPPVDGGGTDPAAKQPS